MSHDIQREASYVARVLDAGDFDYAAQRLREDLDYMDPWQFRELTRATNQYDEKGWGVDIHVTPVGQNRYGTQYLLSLSQRDDWYGDRWGRRNGPYQGYDQNRDWDRSWGGDRNNRWDPYWGNDRNSRWDPYWGNDRNNRWDPYRGNNQNRWRQVPERWEDVAVFTVPNYWPRQPQPYYPYGYRGR